MPHFIIKNTGVSSSPKTEWWPGGKGEGRGQRAEVAYPLTLFYCKAGERRARLSSAGELEGWFLLRLSSSLMGTLPLGGASSRECCGNARFPRPVSSKLYRRAKSYGTYGMTMTRRIDGRRENKNKTSSLCLRRKSQKKLATLSSWYQ